MLSLERVCKSYTIKGVQKVIFHEVTWSFPTDRNVAIMGKNGAGKSTMMRLLSGAELPDKGHIYRDQKVSWPLGFSGGFNGSMTGIENIRFVARIYGQDTDWVTEYVEKFSDLGKSLRLPIKTYSSGMKARLAFGLSMAIDFEIYLIDEITAVGDKNFKEKSNKVFKNKLSNSQIIMVSHSAKTIRDYCDCGILLDGASFKYFGTCDELLEAYSEQASR